MWTETRTPMLSPEAQIWLECLRQATIAYTANRQSAAVSTTAAAILSITRQFYSDIIKELGGNQ